MMEEKAGNTTVMSIMTGLRKMCIFAEQSDFCGFNLPSKFLPGRNSTQTGPDVDKKRIPDSHK